MRYFTVSKKGRKGYNFVEMGYTYELDVDMFGKIESFFIYADSRKAAVEIAGSIVATITFESTTRTVQTQVNEQNGLQQLKVAYRMLDSHEDKEKVHNYIQRLKAHFNIVEETIEEITQTTEEEINEVKNENELTEETQASSEQTFTAYNRSFQSYDLAYSYCTQSDLDPSYIASNVPTKLSYPLQLDLQLFASDTAPDVTDEPIKPFKQPYSSYKDGVHKFGIGKHLDLIFTIETTGIDPNYDEMNYSNVQQHKRTNMDDVISLLNRFQQQGYHNIQLWTEIHYKGNTVIENGTNGQLEFSINNSRLKHADKVNKENNELKQQIKLYESFITHFNATKTFNKYKEEQQSVNLDSNNLYWYEMLLRPLSPACQPKGYISYDDSKGRHGIVSYNRPLTSDELENYELAKWVV